jgi:FtsP/CotA-like multicopper oxidase with cupredoxin domain
MKPMNLKNAFFRTTLLVAVMAAVASLAATAHAAAPGISGGTGTPVFNLTAQPAYLNQPDGSSVYSWGYGCQSTWSPTFLPATIASPSSGCPLMQVPGPTMIVTEGDVVTVNLSNGLPTAAGNTSILFPGFTVQATGGVQGLLAQEAAPAGTVTYTFTASSPGTHSYYSGTQGDLQIEMGLYGAVLVLPKSNDHNIGSCTPLGQIPAHYAPEADFRLAPAAYNHAKACYDREYLFQFAEMDGNIHNKALQQVSDPVRVAACATGASTPGCSLEVPTEPYHPNFFMINGRSMPDDMDANYEVEYPHQPYNGNPHLHPGEQVLLRIIGQGRWQHPFHEHANHVRILGRDGNLILSQSNAGDLAGPALFTTTTTPGQTMDGIFYFTGRGLNWDMYGHNPKSSDTLATLPCDPDLNGYNTHTTALNYYEWCADHNKPLEANPLGDIAGGGPITLPNPNILTNGAWYGGTPYLGPDATTRSGGPGLDNMQPSNAQANPANERGWAYMWHSHNEREITTNNVFPGGMMMMLLVDSREFVIDESN